MCIITQSTRVRACSGRPARCHDILYLLHTAIIAIAAIVTHADLILYIAAITAVVTRIAIIAIIALVTHIAIIASIAIVTQIAIIAMLLATCAPPCRPL